MSELSEAGIFVRTLRPRSIGATFPVTLIIRSVPVKVKAMVVHSVPSNPGLYPEPGMGMKFVEISTTDREVLRNIIKGQILKDISGSNNAVFFNGYVICPVTFSSGSYYKQSMV